MNEQEMAPNPENNQEIGFDVELAKECFNDGSADEYFENVSVLPAEAILEAQGDDRVWTELNDAEKNVLRDLLQEFADKNGFELVEDEISCMVIAKE